MLQNAESTCIKDNIYYSLIKKYSVFFDRAASAIVG